MNWKIVCPVVVSVVLLGGCVASQGASTNSGAPRRAEPPQNDIGARTGGATAPRPQPTPETR